MMSIRTPVLSCIAATAIAVVYGLAAYLPDDAEVFLFPRIIAVLIALLCVMQWVNALSLKGDSTGGETIAKKLRDLLPGMVVGASYVGLLEVIGFYTTSLLAFFAIALIYSSESISVRSVVKKLIVAALFMTVLYLLFWQGLHVRTPQGLLF